MSLFLTLSNLLFQVPLSCSGAKVMLIIFLITFSQRLRIMGNGCLQIFAENQLNIMKKQGCKELREALIRALIFPFLEIVIPVLF